MALLAAWSWVFDILGPIFKILLPIIAEMAKDTAEVTPQEQDAEDKSAYAQLRKDGWIE